MAERRFSDRAVTWLWRRAFSLVATDVTDRTGTARTLVVAPHPDDETFGCGATVARRRAGGGTIRVIIATDGRHSNRSAAVCPEELAAVRAAEAVAAVEALGLGRGDVLLLGHEDGHLAGEVAQLVDGLRAVVAEFRPDEVLVCTARDGHPDHVAANEAVRALVAELPDGCRVAEYLTWYWYAGESFAWVTGGRVSRLGRVLRELRSNLRALRPEKTATRGYLEVKTRAIAAYRSQTTNLSGEPSREMLPPDFAGRFLGRYEFFLPIAAGR
jgi:LmbE family N-acetylglucosaminyl deacetylase